MTSLATLKESLPNFPDEVLETWLLPFAKLRGWPPFLSDGVTPSHDWAYLLLAEPYAYWISLEWNIETISLEPGELTPGSSYTVGQLGMARFMGERNTYSDIDNSQQRFDRVLKYVREKKSYPVPPVLVRRADGLHVVDGNHRVTAYFTVLSERMHTGLQPLPPMRYWVAQPNNSFKPMPLRGTA